MSASVISPGVPVITPVRKPPGRPRSTRVDAAIVAAALDLLLEGVTAEALTIEAVAARAGVGKATIYRRWVNKDALLLDTIAALEGPPPTIRGASVREDLVTLLRPVGRALAVLPGLVSELRRNPTLHASYLRVIEPRRALLAAVLRRGIATGELRADLDLDAVMTLLASPVLAQLTVNLHPGLDQETLPDRLVDALWPAVTAVR
jgi:AcrR family transcriptional regulator